MKARAKRVWMLGTDFDGKGGIASVLRQYRGIGFFADGRVRFAATHRDSGFAGRVLPALLCAWRLWPALLFRKVALVHIHASYGGSFWRKLLLAAPAFWLKVPVLIHLHAGKYMDFYRDGGPWRKACVRYLFRRAYGVVALSGEWAAWVKSVEPSAKVHVIFNSISADFGRECAGGHAEQPVVLFLGRIGQRKGTFDLLQAFGYVLKHRPNARMIVGGDGDSAALLEEAARLGIERSVEYAGWVGEADKRALLSKCWLFALPSYEEGLPMAVLEALAFSRAIVSTPVGGIPEAVAHGASGLLVKPGDVPALGEALLQVLSDRSTAVAMGQAGRKVFQEKFSCESNIPVLLDIYRAAGVEHLPALALAARK